VVFSKVNFERIVVNKVLLLSAAITSVANVATFVLVSAMGVEFVVSIEALSAEAALWVSLETALIDSAGVIVAKLLVFPQLRICEQFVFMGEDFLISRTKVAIQC
jgi:hypothetical protein